MAIQHTKKNEGKMPEVRVNGKLLQEDYQLFVPEFERLVKRNGENRVTFELAAFHGWAGADLWDNIKTDLEHLSDSERVAMVGGKIGGRNEHSVGAVHHGKDPLLRSSGGRRSASLAESKQRCARLLITEDFL
jgi:hypothetical protein